MSSWCRATGRKECSLALAGEVSGARRGLPGFEWRSTARAWAYALARHAMSRHVASAQRRARRDVPLSRSPELVARVRSATATLLRTGIKQELRSLIEGLRAEDQLLLTLRLERRRAFRELAVALSDAPDPLDDAAVTREAARLRKRYQLVKDRLRAMSIEAGLLASEA